MKQKTKKRRWVDKEAIIMEYLTGEQSYRKLGIKYGINFRWIHSWVSKFKSKPLKKREPDSAELLSSKETAALPTEVRLLQEELRKSKLYNELLNTMIDIAEAQLKIDIRKKSGTKR